MISTHTTTNKIPAVTPICSWFQSVKKCLVVLLLAGVGLSVSGCSHLKRTGEAFTNENCYAWSLTGAVAGGVLNGTYGQQHRSAGPFPTDSVPLGIIGGAFWGYVFCRATHKIKWNERKSKTPLPKMDEPQSTREPQWTW